MKINLSDAEWMNPLWENSPRTITELTEALKAQHANPSA